MNYLKSVKIDGFNLEYIPEEFQTLEICLAAVKQNRLAVRYCCLHKNKIKENRVPVDLYVNLLKKNV
jgi:hypothetical protein